MESKNKYIIKYIIYDGKVVGYIHPYSSHGNDKFNIHLDGFGTLEKLCRLNSEEILKVDGMQEMKYEEFKENIFDKSEAVYFSMKIHMDFNPSRNPW